MCNYTETVQGYTDSGRFLDGDYIPLGKRVGAEHPLRTILTMARDLSGLH